MYRRLSGIAVGVVGLALVLVAVAAATGSAPAATPTAFPPGITFERLAASPPGSLGLPGPHGPGTLTEVMVRITYASGAVFAFHAPGPILYYIEQGTLTIQLNPGHTAIVLHDGSSGHSSFTFHGNQPITLSAGQGIYADDGYIGATRNAGQTAVVVLATYLVPQVLVRGGSHHATNTVSPVVSTPAT